MSVPYTALSAVTSRCDLNIYILYMHGARTVAEAGAVNGEPEAVADLQEETSECGGRQRATPLEPTFAFLISFKCDCSWV